MNWTKLALHIPQIIGIAISAVEKIKGAKGPEKEAAVIATAQETLAGLEDAFDVDLVNNDALRTLAQNYIAAKVALLNGISAAKALKPAVNQ